jgi:septal ring factor EnvC (AmiA/AmiB activator)
MLSRLVKSWLLLSAVLLVAGLMAGCAANLPCTIGEDQVEQARAKAGSADKQMQQANQKAADLEAQIQTKQTAVDELKTKKTALEEELKKAGG